MTNPIVRAYKWLDEDVLLRQYSKVAKKWEDKGRNIYHLSTAIGFPSIFMSCNAISNLIISDILPIRVAIALTYTTPLSFDATYNASGLNGRIEEDTISNSRNISPFIEMARVSNRATRLLFFSSAVGVLAKSGYDVYNYAVNGEPLPDNFYDLTLFGLGHLGLASSMYLKDRDPKLLDKQPAWKKALESTREKAGELSDRIRDWIPQPAPELAPVRYQTLEGYLD